MVQKRSIECQTASMLKVRNYFKNLVIAKIGYIYCERVELLFRFGLQMGYHHNICCVNEAS